MLRPLLVALQFMTRLPVPRSWLAETYDDKLMGQSVLAYPLVGLVIGVILWAVATLLHSLPPLVVAAVILLSWVLITGALHLDGLADCADAWVGGHGDREKTLAIMKDSFIGPVGVAMLVWVLLIKFSALSALTTFTPALLFPPVLSRSFVVLFFLTTPYVRKKGLGERQAMAIPTAAAYTLMLIVVAAVTAVAGNNGLWLIGIALASFLLLRWWSVASIGGMTGDTAGAMIEMLECIILVGILWIF